MGIVLSRLQWWCGVRIAALDMLLPQSMRNTDMLASVSHSCTMPYRSTPRLGSQ